MQRLFGKLGGRLRAAASLSMLLALSLGSIASAQDRGAASTYHGNPARTGEQPGPSPKGDGKLLWRYQTAGAVRSSPIVVDGTLYFGSNDGSLYAIDAKSGEPKWSFTTDGPVRSTAAVADGSVYFGSGDGYVYALSAKDGKLRWRFYAARGDIDPAQSLNSDLLRRTVTAPVTVVDDTVLVATNDFSLFAIDAKTGIERWNQTAMGATVTAPAVADGVVVVGSEFGLEAYDLETGAPVWVGNWIAQKQDADETDDVTINITSEEDDSNDTTSTATDEEQSEESEAEAESGDGIITVAEFFSSTHGDLAWDVKASPSIVDGFVFAVGFAKEKQALEGESSGRVGGVLLVLDAKTGGVVGSWIFKSYDQVLTTPTVIGNTVFLGTDQGFLYAYDAQNGREAWGVQTEDYLRASPAFVGSTIYAGNAGGTLYSFDSKSGKSNWTFATGGAIWSSPAVVGGIVYVGSDDGFLYAIGGS